MECPWLPAEQIYKWLACLCQAMAWATRNVLNHWKPSGIDNMKPTSSVLNAECLFWELGSSILKLTARHRSRHTGVCFDSLKGEGIWPNLWQIESKERSFTLVSQNMCVCVSICLSIYLPTYLSIYLSIYAYINIYTYKQRSIDTWIYIYRYLFIYLFFYLYLCIHTYAHTCIRTYIHTYIDT